MARSGSRSAKLDSRPKKGSSCLRSAASQRRRAAGRCLRMVEHGSCGTGLALARHGLRGALDGMGGGLIACGSPRGGPARRGHAVVDHPARHDLSLPAAGRLRRAPDDAASARLPRSESDRRRGSRSAQSRGACASFRTNSATMSRSRSSSDRSTELRFESIVCLEHSPAGRCRCRRRRQDLSCRLGADEMPDLAPFIERHHPDPDDEVGRWARQFLPSDGGAIGTLDASHPALPGHSRGFLYRRRESQGNPAAGGDAPARRRGVAAILPLLMIEAARALGLRGAVRIGYIAP